MKSVCLLFIVIFFPVSLFAQRDTISGRSAFEDFRQELLGEFDDFRKEVNAEYADFLSQAWKEYRLSQGKKADEMPKPLKPVACQDEKNERDAVVEVISESAPAIKETAPSFKEEKRDFAQSDGLESVDIFQLDYFGASLNLRYQQIPYQLPSIVENSIGNLWKDISKSRFTTLLADMLAYKRAMQMNDWAYYLLARKVADRLPAFQSEDCRTVFLHFLLVQSGYDIRLARIDDFLVLLVPVLEEVYARPYLTIDGKQFYAITRKGLSSYTRIYTYQLPKRLIDKPCLTLRMRKELLLPMQRKTYSVKAGGLDVSGEVNINRMRFFQTYLSCELSVYADAYPSASFSRKLVASLTSQLSGKPKERALNSLLNWTQNGFRYQTDGEQFGTEKSFFIEENFFYPASDCEDRAILFAYLVREVLGKDVVLLDYPGHVSTAVCMDKEEVKGAHILLDGKKYVMCDPTYINAEAGRVMPFCKGKRPTVIRLNND